MKAVFAVLALAALGCGPAPHSRAAGAVTTLAVRPVAWNPANAPIGTARAVADAGDVVCVFADEGASIFSAKAVVARDEQAKGWSFGAAVWATDGTTPWIVGIDGNGRLHRLRGMSTFEDVTARYGLGDQRLGGATIAGRGRVGFLLASGLALGDVSNVSLYPSSSFRTLAGGGGFVAGVGANTVDLVNATNAFVTHFALEGVTAAALDGKGRLYAATARAIYAADATGALVLVYDAGHDGLHGLVASGDRVWFSDRAELGVVDGDHVAETSGLGLGASATLQGSPSGDVWVIDRGRLQRFEAAASAALPAATWAATVAPVFARSCAGCHQPAGVSGTDLSTEAAWSDKRTLVRERVLTTRTMPPQGHPLADADREALRRWLDERK